MRGALGASRGRIVRQLLTESLVLSGVGAAFGLLLAFIMVSWLAHQGAIALPLLSTLRIDGAALAWTYWTAGDRRHAVRAELLAISASARNVEGLGIRVQPEP